MVDSISSFQKALAFQNAVQMKMKRQVRFALDELNSEAIETPEPIKPKLIRRTSVAAPTGGSSTQRSAQQRTPVSTGGTQVTQPQVTSGRTVTSQQRTRSVSGRTREVIQSKRNRKAIANTQADKRGRDSGGLTTLATSGIDGKGLKINQIR